MVLNDTFSSDDEEDQCPLCIEDMDATDKSFKPCPCGFQICQFCYNNIRSGPEQYNRCPACRRPYDDESIEYTTLTAEDLKREQERKQRKEQERKQREREKNKEQTHYALHGARDKKHLANMRVIQKNLVYVIGLNPSIPSEELQQMLRRDEFFGQYGKIQKIVINKRMNSSGHPGVGVYVTFARKEDAARCIAAVDGSMNDGKYLRAAYGTTKYCSSYLRGQNCPNPNCMFLHEPGEEADSFNKHSASHPSSHSGPAGLGGAGGAATLPSLSGSAAANTAASSTNLSSNTVGAGGLNAVLASREVPHLPTASPQLSSSNLNDPHSQGPSRVGTPALGSGGGAPAVVAANAPALPAWGKAVPQIPPVQKINTDYSQDVAQHMLRELSRNLTTLSSTSSSNWGVEFLYSEETARFPAMFSLPMDEKKRLKTYNKALTELDKVAPKPQPQVQQQPPESPAQTQANSHSQIQQQTQVPPAQAGARLATPTSASSSAGSTPVPGSKGDKKNNSQQLLAQLMKKPSEDLKTDTERRSKSGSPVGSAGSTGSAGSIGTAGPIGTAPTSTGATNSAPTNANTAANANANANSAAAAAANSTSSAHSTEPPVAKVEKLDINKAVSLVSKEQQRLKDQNDKQGLLSDLAGTLRTVGSDLMQPGTVPQVNVPEDIQFEKSKYIDDGPSFDVHNLPAVPITGDADPSVWSALEEYTRSQEVLQMKEKEYAAAKAQTKKRLKRMRV